MVFRELVVGKQAREDAHDRDVTLAWVGAALQRQKRLPDLKSLLTKRTPKKQTQAQLKTMLYQIGEQFGITVRQRKKARRG